MFGDEGRGIGDEGLEAAVFLGLHEAQVPLGHLDIPPPRQRAEDPEPGGLHAEPGKRLVAGARDAVEHDARNVDALAEAREAARHRRRGLRLARDIEHQHHRPAGAPGDVRAGAVAALARLRHAVEEAHGAFGEHQVGAARARQMRIEHVGRHGPAVEIERDPPRGRAVKRRVDVVWPALEGLHREPAVAEGAGEPQHDRGLPGARGGRGDHEAAGEHHASCAGKRGAAPTGRNRRS